MPESQPRAAVTYRTERLYALPAIGLHLITAGVAAALAYLVWPPLGFVAALLLADALRLAVFPPIAVRTDGEGLRCGGRLVWNRQRIAWTAVEDVSVGRSLLILRSGEDVSVVVPLAYIGARRDDLVRDVYDRLNHANGYRRYDPS